MTLDDADFLLWNGLRGANAFSVRKALELGADPNQLLKQDIPSLSLKAGDAPLHAAFKPAMTKERGPNGKLLKDWEGVGEVVSLLLDKGANATLLDSKGYTPLMLCCAHERVKIDNKSAEKLISASKAVINHADPDNEATALHLAAGSLKYAFIKKLFAIGADPHHLDAYEANALWRVLNKLNEEYLYAKPAVSAGWKTVDALLKGGCDINLPNQSERTVVMSYHRIPIAEMVKRGANLTQVVRNNTLLLEMLDVLEGNRERSFYVMDRLEHLAATPGVDWSTTSRFSGREARSILIDLARKESDDPRWNALLATIATCDYASLDEATSLAVKTKSLPRL